MDITNFVFIFIILPILILLYKYFHNLNSSKIILILISLFIYGLGNPLWVLILLFISLFTYIFARIIEDLKHDKMKYFIMIVSIFLNLLILSFFKYSNFSKKLFFNLKLDEYFTILPIGISFYIISTISYLIDIYRGNAKTEKKYFNLLLYLSYFPKLFAGPLIKYKDFAPNLKKFKFNLNDVRIGIIICLHGLLKKVIFANVANEIVDKLLNKDISNISFWGGWFGILIFGIQVYYDFSGYSDIAIGLSKMFSINLKVNFNYPFTSKSITEFWRRWHISLTDWFSEYLTTPILFKLRYSKIFSFFIAIFTTFLISGIWHGNSINFLLWGLYFGIIVFLEFFFISKLLKKLPIYLNHLYFIVMILPSWALFYFRDIKTLYHFILKIFYIEHIDTNIIDVETFYLFKTNIFWFILALFFTTPFYKEIIIKTKQIFNIENKIYTDLVYFIIFLFIIINQLQNSINSFVYFKF
jgi:alginate O-acetyltransferase complex protein AlgI